MARGFTQAEKVGKFKGRGNFQPRPKGLSYFSLSDQQQATVRFLSMHEDIEWARKWKIGVFPNQELVNAVDQHEDGTPDPGYQHNLKPTFKAYPLLIWRNGPIFQRNPDGTFFRDAAKKKVLTGYGDQVVVWECSFEVYSTLRELDQKYQGLMSRDFDIKRVGASTDTTYLILPDGDSSPLSPSDQQLISTGRIDTAQFTKPPTYDELNAYLSGGSADAPTPTFQEQAQQVTQQGAGAANPFLTS